MFMNLKELSEPSLFKDRLTTDKDETTTFQIFKKIRQDSNL